MGRFVDVTDECDRLVDPRTVPVAPAEATAIILRAKLHGYPAVCHDQKNLPEEPPVWTVPGELFTTPFAEEALEHEEDRQSLERIRRQSRAFKGRFAGRYRVESRHLSVAVGVEAKSTAGEDVDFACIVAVWVRIWPRAAKVVIECVKFAPRSLEGLCQANDIKAAVFRLADPVGDVIEDGVVLGQETQAFCQPFNGSTEGVKGAPLGG